MEYCLHPDVAEPIMLLDRFIGDDGEGTPYIDGNQFARELLMLDQLGKKRIQVWINSPGGIVTEGMSIYNAILTTRTKVDTYCMGIAASIAAVIFQAGRNRTMADYGQLMFHNPSGGDRKSLAAVQDSIIKMISNRCGQPYDKVSQIMTRESWMNAEESKVSGMCDVIESSTEKNRPRKMTEDAVAFYSDANKIINSIFNNKTMNEKELRASLDLPETATNEEVSAAINALKASKAKKLTPEEEKEAEDARALVNSAAITAAITAAVKPITDKLTAVEAKLAEEESKVTKAAALAIVNKHIDRIGGKTATEEVINKWVDAAVKNAEETEKLLAALPLKSVDITDSLKTIPLKEGDVPTTAAGFMAKAIKNQAKMGFQTPYDVAII